MKCLVTQKKESSLQPFDVFIHFEGQDWEEPHLSLSSLVSDALIQIRQEHADWAYNLAHAMFHAKQLAAHLEGNEQPSMWWCSLLYERHPKMTPNLYSIYALRALELFFESHAVTDVTFEGNDHTFAICLEEMCKNMHISFAMHPCDVPQKTEKRLVNHIYQKLPPLLRVILRMIHWLWKVKRALPRTKLPPHPEKTATIVTYFPNIDLDLAKKRRFRSHYFENLHDLLNKKACGSHFVRWLFIRFPSPTLSFSECCALKNVFNEEKKDGFSFHYLEEFLSLKDIVSSIKRYFRIARASRLLKKDIPPHFSFPSSHLNFWPYCRKDWIESFEGWRCLERCLQNQAFIQYAREAGPQRFTLFPLENCPWERMLISHMRHSGGLILGMQHSSLRPTDLRYFDSARAYAEKDLPIADLLLANGEASYTQWHDSGIPKEKLRKVEALRYLHLACANDCNAAPQKKLLVLTSFFRDETQDILALLCKAYQRNLLSGWDVCIKPHPYLDVEQFLPKNHSFRIGGGPLQNYFKKGVLVWAANSTTAQLEAAIIGLPLATMRASNDFDLSPIQDLSSLLRTSNLADVSAMLALKEGITVPPDYLLLDPRLTEWEKLLPIEE